MNVFTIYSEAHATSLRLWVRSWQSHNFTPRLLTARELPKAKAAIRKRGGGIFVPPGAFNVSHKRGKFVARTLGKRGWEKASVVVCPPETPESVILECCATAH